jgi:hypothetical protein
MESIEVIAIALSSVIASLILVSNAVLFAITYNRPKDYKIPVTKLVINTGFSLYCISNVTGVIFRDQCVNNMWFFMTSYAIMMAGLHMMLWQNFILYLFVYYKIPRQNTIHVQGNPEGRIFEVSVKNEIENPVFHYIMHHPYLGSSSSMIKGCIFLTALYLSFPLCIYFTERHTYPVTMFCIKRPVFELITISILNVLFVFPCTWLVYNVNKVDVQRVKTTRLSAVLINWVVTLVVIGILYIIDSEYSPYIILLINSVAVILPWYFLTLSTLISIIKDEFMDHSSRADDSRERNTGSHIYDIAIRYHLEHISIKDIVCFSHEKNKIGLDTLKKYVVEKEGQTNPSLNNTLNTIDFLSAYFITEQACSNQYPLKSDNFYTLMTPKVMRICRTHFGYGEESPKSPVVLPAGEHNDIFSFTTTISIDYGTLDLTQYSELCKMIESISYKLLDRISGYTEGYLKSPYAKSFLEQWFSIPRIDSYINQKNKHSKETSLI